MPVMHGGLGRLATGRRGLGRHRRLGGRRRRDRRRQGGTGNTADGHGLLHSSKRFNVIDRLLPRDTAIPADAHVHAHRLVATGILSGILLLFGSVSKHDD